MHLTLEMQKIWLYRSRISKYKEHYNVASVNRFVSPVKWTIYQEGSLLEALSGASPDLPPASALQLASVITRCSLCVCLPIKTPVLLD